jgi:hypothetical protein
VSPGGVTLWPTQPVVRVAASHGRRRKGLSPLALKTNLDHMRAPLIIAIQLLAVHAVDALVDIDVPPGWIDRMGHSLAQRWQGEPHSGQRPWEAAAGTDSRPGLEQAALHGVAGRNLQAERDSATARGSYRQLAHREYRRQDIPPTSSRGSRSNTFRPENMAETIPPPSRNSVTTTPVTWTTIAPRRA